MKTNEIYYANMTLLRTLKFFKQAVSEGNVDMSHFYENMFDAQWTILYHMDIKHKTYNYEWFSNYMRKHLFNY